MRLIAALLATPARQAIAWTTLGIAGMAFAAGGILLMTRDSGAASGPVRAGAAAASATTRTPLAGPTAPGVAASASATSTSAVTPSPVAPASPSPSATVTPTPTATAGRPSSAGQAAPQPANTPTPEPTAAATAVATSAPVVAGGPYCNTVSATAPPNSVFGRLRAGGADVPAGTVVTLTFDGVPGPSKATTEAGGYKVNWAAAGEGCANRAGAAIGVTVNGQHWETGASVGGGGGTPVVVFHIDG